MLALADTKLALDEQVSAEAAVSGELAGNIDIDEGSEGIIEKKVKTSLMSTLQKRFDGGEIEIPDEEAVKTEAFKMEGAEDGTPAAEADNKAAPAKGAAGRMKFKLAPKREKPKLDDDGEEIKDENGEDDEDEDDALSSVASDAGSEYEES